MKRTAERATRESIEKKTGDTDAECGKRMGMMPLGPRAARRGVRSRTELAGRVAVTGRRARGKTASFRDQEAVSGNVERGVRRKAAPATPLKV